MWTALEMWTGLSSTLFPMPTILSRNRKGLTGRDLWGTKRRIGIGSAEVTISIHFTLTHTHSALAKRPSLPRHRMATWGQAHAAKTPEKRNSESG